MSEIYSRISRRMWGDAGFRALSGPQPNARDLWIYLLTGPHNTPIPGLFSVTRAGLAERLGWSFEGFAKALAELLPDSFSDVSQNQSRDAWLEADWTASVVWIRDSILHNEPSNPNVVLGWRKHWILIPECELKESAYQRLKSYMECKGKPFAEALAKSCGKQVEAGSGVSGSGSGSGTGGKRRAVRRPESDKQKIGAEDAGDAGGVGADAPSKPQPGRLLMALQDSVRAAYMRADSPGQKAGDKQWLAGCERVQDALDLKLFPDAQNACDALAVAVVTETMKPDGKALGFALQQTAFVATQPPPRPPADHAPRLLPKGSV